MPLSLLVPSTLLPHLLPPLLLFVVVAPLQLCRGQHQELGRMARNNDGGGGGTSNFFEENNSIVPPAAVRNCSSCVDRELFKNFTREDVREKILRKLGMSEAPNVSAADAVPTHLVRQLLSRYRHHLMQNDQADDDWDQGGDEYHFQTRQINIIAKPLPTVYALRLSASTASTWDIQYFPLPALEQHFSSAVARARLYMHLPAAPMPVEDNGHAWINVYSVSVDKKGHTFLNQEAAAKVRLYPGHGGWTEVDVWELTALWFKHPAENMGLVIQVNTAAGQALKVGVQHQPQLAPFLQLDLRDGASSDNRRNKRTLHKVCTEKDDSRETHCCLWPITIDFEREFGWKWIIHPPKYEANYCAGDCSLGVMMPSNPYSHLLQQANGSPCCAPQKMSGMNMLYMDESKNVILGKLPNMRVDRCGCI